MTLLRSIVIVLVVVSVFLVIFPAKPTTAELYPTTSTTTWTSTMTATLTGTGSTTIYQMYTQVTSVPTMTGTTYTTTEVVGVPVELTMTAVSQVTTRIYGDLVTTYVTITRTAESYYPSLVQGAVTIQYTTNVPATMFSTIATTSTYTTAQAITVTNKQTSTSVREQFPTVIIVVAAAIAVAAAAVVLHARYPGGVPGTPTVKKVKRWHVHWGRGPACAIGSFCDRCNGMTVSCRHIEEISFLGIVLIPAFNSCVDLKDVLPPTPVRNPPPRRAPA